MSFINTLDSYGKEWFGVPNYIQVDSSSMKIVAEAFSPNIMIEVENLDARRLGCTYNPDTGKITGYRVILTTDRQYIRADGTDTVRVTTSIKTWDDQDANSTFSDPIMFVVDGTPKLVTKKAEGYFVDYNTTTAGTKIISVQDDKFIGSASISILAAEVE